ncbi:MAG: peroxiredoxin [Bifidobacteriaceae bacterium]|jgi:peroxiredoxin Q/BCP|nr:peroxiredoxin [Bifidobacteriaceae bacterium]
MAVLQVGDAAPSFTLPTSDGDPISLEHFKGHKVVLYAFPQAFTPGCSIQAQDFRDAFPAFDGAGYTLVGLSPDTPAKLSGFAEELSLPYPLLSDTDHAVLDLYGAWGQKRTFGRNTVGVIRSTFVMDTEGILTLVEYGVKAPGYVPRLAAELGIDWDGE